jgi:rod shape-determining protein MreC
VALPDIRHRFGYLFLVLAVGHIILISAQVNSTSGVPLLQAAVFGAFAGIQQVSSGVVMGVRNVWDGYVALRRVHQENEALRGEVTQLKIELQKREALARETEDLQRLLDLRSRVELRTRGAEIIGGSAAPDFRTVTVNLGARDGLGKDMAVLVSEGVVGRVVLTSPRAAKVQLLIDRNAAAGAILVRTRTEGVVIGTGDGRLRLDYVSATAEVKAGDEVISSGTDGIYPKGFSIGIVESVERGGRGIVLRPAVDFSKLEHVLVVVERPPRADGEGTE